MIAVAGPFDDVQPVSEKKIVVELINEFDPSNTDKRSVWVSGRLYALSIREHPDSFVLLFLRSWQDGESFAAVDEVEAVEATYIKDTKRVLLPTVRVHQLTGDARNWMSSGPFAGRYVDRE